MRMWTASEGKPGKFLTILSGFEWALQNGHTVTSDCDCVMDYRFVFRFKTSSSARRL